MEEKWNEDKTEKLREKLRVQISVRGTSSHYALPESKEAPKGTYHHYLIPTDGRITHAEFFQKLHATLSAAVGRALEHSTEYARLRPRHYPELRFSTQFFTIMQSRAMVASPGKKTSEKYEPLRPEYEEALVEGAIMQTFAETGSSMQSSNKSWFRVKLTKRELERIHRKAKAIVASCTNKEPEYYGKWFRERRFQRPLIRLGYKIPSRFTAETTGVARSGPYGFLLYNETRRLLVAKALRRLEKEIEKLPE